MDQSTIDMIAQQLEQRIASKTLSLPMLPQVTTEVMSLVNDIDSDAAALSKLIQSDQALAGHVMRIANSAAYSPTVKMTSLQQAIARLGMQNIAEIAMAATMGPKMFSVKGFEDIVKDIWQSSLATAVWAREIARQGRRNVESTFLCGLLYQIGRPVVLQTVLDINQNSDDELLPEVVIAMMDKYQTEVGSILADNWQLPAAVKHTIVGVVDKAGECTAAGAQDIVDTVKAASIFSAVTIADRNYDAAILSADTNIIHINLYTDDVDELLEKAESVHDTIGALSI
jgi:HD-like signal output (HDOD) protein